LLEGGRRTACGLHEKSISKATANGDASHIESKSFSTLLSAAQ
jgi:hypothetical protein